MRMLSLCYAVPPGAVWLETRFRKFHAEFVSGAHINLKTLTSPQFDWHCRGPQRQSDAKPEHQCRVCRRIFKEVSLHGSFRSLGTFSPNLSSLFDVGPSVAQLGIFIFWCWNFLAAIFLWISGSHLFFLPPYPRDERGKSAGNGTLLGLNPAHINKSHRPRTY